MTRTLVASNPPKTKLAQDAIAIWLAGVEAVRSDRVVESQVEWDGRWLTIAEQVFDLKGANQLVIVGAGKATAGMLAGLFSALMRSQKKLPSIAGWINVPQGSAAPVGPLASAVTVCQARPHGCNEPTQKVVDGTKHILESVRNVRRNDCVVSLISGGGSALLCAPPDGMTLEQKIEITRALSASGANIEQLNSVRRCLSQVKGGGLARNCNARQMITCIISDVLGDPLDLIASGPTVLAPAPDPLQALEILDSLLPNQCQWARDILRNQLRVGAGPSRKMLNPQLELSTIVLANNATAVDAAGQKAVELGYRYWMKSERKSEGDAVQLGQNFANQLKATRSESQIDCIISGGEPTVLLPPSDLRGKGGRNQQLVLSLLHWFKQNGCWSNDKEMAFVSGGTDGEDGPTDAAGAFVDSHVYQRMMDTNLDAADYLRRCDAYAFFQQTEGLLTTGPSGTNVCDLRIGLVGTPSR